MGTQHAVGILFKLLWFCGARGVLAGLGKKKKKKVLSGPAVMEKYSVPNFMDCAWLVEE